MRGGGQGGNNSPPPSFVLWLCSLARLQEVGDPVAYGSVLRVVIDEAISPGHIGAAGV